LHLAVLVDPFVLLRLRHAAEREAEGRGGESGEKSFHT